jgi:biotin carboxylase
MQRILLVGSHPTTTTTQLTDHLQSLGYDYCVLEDSRDTERFTGQRPSAYWFRADFSDKQAVLRAADHLPHPIDAVLSMYENYIVACAWLTTHLGLPGMDETTARICTDKLLMRQAFIKAPQTISPSFSLADSLDAVEQFAADHGYPVIIKPANLAKSLLVTKSNNLEDLRRNYRDTTAALQTAYQRFARDRQPRLIVEEFITGSMHSVVTFADSQGKVTALNEIVDLERAADIGFDDNFLYCRSLPSTLEADQQQALIDCAITGVAALGMRSSPAHVELILSPDGARIVEIGARLGGYRERMFCLAAGTDLLRSAVDSVFGRKPQFTTGQVHPCAVFELFPVQSGRFKGIRHAKEAQDLPSCRYFTAPQKAGNLVGKAAAGYKCCAIVILQNNDPEQFAKDLQFIKDQVEVITTPVE